jgi:hypothetical protein
MATIAIEEPNDELVVSQMTTPSANGSVIEREEEILHLQNNKKRSH